MNNTRRIVLHEDELGRAFGFYVSWICRYRDEADYELRRIGSDQTKRITVYDDGRFCSGATRDDMDAIRAYLRAERTEFIEWCARYNANPNEYPPHAVIAA